MPISEQEFYSILDLTRLFRVSRPTVNKWLQSGELPFMRVESTIRIRRSDVEQFISDNLAKIAAKASA
ncbi:MAG TPA: helix-turn-helix domain-containing protein [Candidatus Binatia bacterium]|nr:helix-turn-helix domain-containing protein [Candidatus Binatia bacterium]